MKAMFAERVQPRLAERFVLRPGRLVTIKTTGIGESDMQARIGNLAHPGLEIGTRTVLPENHLKLRFDADVPESEVRAITDEAVRRIGSPVFVVDGPGLAEVVGRALFARGETLAVAESCTGGRVAAACTAIPGSSRWFAEGVVTYSNAAKVRVLGVDAGVIEASGAVSEPVARQMAAGLRERSGATYALAITGIAGPDGGSPEKPVGTVHLAMATSSSVVHRLIHLGGDRTRIQDLAAGAALDLLRRHLQEQL
jgi:nicotinamide-nucleotide amidase